MWATRGPPPLAPSLPSLGSIRMNLSDNSVLAGASRVLQERIPPGWAVERVASLGQGERLRIRSAEGRARELVVAALARPDPRAVGQLPTDRPLIVAAPYLSPATREAIAAAGASYVDHTGHVRLVLDEP